MKHIIILGDGMADHPVERLGGKTLYSMPTLRIWTCWQRTDAPVVS